MIQRKRVYEPPAADDGYRVVVERLWPRGIRKEVLRPDAWERGIAPSTELRRWYGHEPAKWEEFQQRYERELAAPEARAPLARLTERARRENVAVLYAAHDGEHSNATVLERLLTEQLAARDRERPDAP